MDDLISRQDAIEAVQNRHMMLNKEKVLLINDLEKLPSTELPRIRGQWSIKGQTIDTVRGYWATCSACGYAVFGGGNYCSNCGSYNKGQVTE